MKADPQIRAWLERTAARVPVDAERTLDTILSAPRPKRSRRVSTIMLAATLAVAATVIAVGAVIVSQRSANDPGFVTGIGEEPAGRLAFGRRTEAGTGLFSLEVSAGVQAPVAPGLDGLTAAKWSPDGSRIAYTIEEDGGARYALVVARADGSDPVKIVEHEKGDPTLPGPDFVAVAWSPDGKQLAYSGRTIYRGRTVSILSADGTNERVLDGHWESVSWSPDGEHLLLLGWPDAEREGHFDLYRMRPDGTDLQQLTFNDLTEFSATWSPDGSRIAFARADGPAQDANVDIYVMDADGTSVTRLTEEASLDVQPVWSPAGDWIAFASDRDASDRDQRANLAEGSGSAASIYVIRPDGSDARRLLDGAGDVTFPLSWTD